MSKFTLFCCLILSLGIVSCRKKPLAMVNEPAPTKGTLNIKINNVVGSKPLVLGNSENYTLPNGESFSVSTFDYYISNFIFTDINGNKFIEPESYHLVMAKSPESLNVTIKDLPFGEYKSVEFLIGVDSLRNFSGAQSGALDPKYGMFWSWSSGYIMARIEGASPQSAAPNGSIAYHIGGFEGPYSVIQKVKLSFTQNALVKATIAPTVKVKADVAAWFQYLGFENFSFNKIPMLVSEGQTAFQISQNYSTMFSVDSVIN